MKESICGVCYEMVWYVMEKIGLILWKIGGTWREQKYVVMICYNRLEDSMMNTDLTHRFCVQCIIGNVRISSLTGSGNVMHKFEENWVKKYFDVAGRC